jgi:hypothetical protein
LRKIPISILLKGNGYKIYE